MKMKNIFYLIIITALIISMFNCKLTLDPDKIHETTAEDTLPELTRGYTWENFCPTKSFSGHNANGYYNCSSKNASVTVNYGGGILTFNMTGGLKYRVSGNIIKYGASNGKFTSPTRTVNASSSSQSIYSEWTSGNCSLSADGSYGGTYLNNLVFSRQKCIHTYGPWRWVGCAKIRTCTNCGYTQCDASGCRY